MKLRNLMIKDADGMLEWMHSKLSHEVFVKDFNNYTKKDVIAFIENISHNFQELHYACVDDNDEYLGTVSLKNIDYQNKNAEFAISFIEKARGSGATKFATITLLDEAFNKLQLNKVYLNVLDINKRAIAFYEKIGFKQEGIFKNHIFKNDNFHDLYWYAFESSDFNHKYNSN